MARSITEIYDALISEKEAQTSLNALVPNPDTAQTFLADLTSNSKVAIWRLWLWVVAVGIHVHEVIIDTHKTEVEALADELITGTDRWLRSEALKFQYGDNLTFNTTTKRFEYLVVDTNKQIIKRAAVVETAGQVNLKVAKEVAGVAAPLDPAEKSAFITYIDQIRFAGTSIGVISLDADKLKLAYDVTYDPLVLDATGTLISDGVTKPVEDAINTAISDLSTIENFNGVLNLTSLTDAVQGAVGVVDPVLTLAEGRPDIGTYTTIIKNYTASAGYLVIDPAFPLATQITYTSA